MASNKLIAGLMMLGGGAAVLLRQLFSDSVGVGRNVNVPVEYPTDPNHLYGHYWDNRLPPGLPAGTRPASTPGGGATILEEILARYPDINFIRAVRALAKHESGKTLGLPAVTFCSKPTGGDCDENITSWGIFQYNAGAWRSLASASSGMPAIPGGEGETYPWEASVINEILRPVERFWQLWNAVGGSSSNKAYSVYLYFVAPAYWRRWRKGENFPYSIHENVIARIGEIR